MATIRRDIGAGHHFIFDDTLVSHPNAEMFTPDFWQLQDKITGQAKGRGTTIFIEHEGQRWVLRHFKRGGLVGKVSNICEHKVFLCLFLLRRVYTAEA